MASEVFLAVFCAHFNVCYDVSNESCLRWWINEKHVTLQCPPTYAVIRRSHALCNMRDTVLRCYYG